MTVAKHCVVVADDNESLRFLLVQVLKDHPWADAFELRDVSDGPAALAVVGEALERGAKVLLFSDNVMAGMSGAELVRSIRGKHGADRVSAIVISASDPPEEVVEDIRRSGARFTVRPMQLSALREIVDGSIRAWLGSGGVSLPVRSDERVLRS